MIIYWHLLPLLLGHLSEGSKHTHTNLLLVIKHAEAVLWAKALAPAQVV